MAVSVKPFGRFWNQDIKATVLSNKNGMEVEVLVLGQRGKHIDIRRIPGQYVLICSKI